MRFNLEASVGCEQAACTLVMTRHDNAAMPCRFLKTDKLQTLYDFVDTSEPGEEWPHGSYLLVTSRPRKVPGGANPETAPAVQAFASAWSVLGDVTEFLFRAWLLSSDALAAVRRSTRRLQSRRWQTQA